MVLPPELAALREQFEMLYHGKYSSRVLQFLFERSEYTLEYVLPASCLASASNANASNTFNANTSNTSNTFNANTSNTTNAQPTTPETTTILLTVNLPQYLLLHAFATVTSFTAGDLQTLTNLPLSVVLETARQLAQEASGPLLRLTPGATDNATSVSLCETPRFASTRVRLIPTAHMTVHVQQAIPSQDMSAMHKTKVDAAIVRIIKTAKFMGFKDLVAKLNAFLDFIPEEQFVKERVESLIAKDYLERDEKDPSILVYQPWCVCHKQQHLSKNTQKTANTWGYN